MLVRKNVEDDHRDCWMFYIIDQPCLAIMLVLWEYNWRNLQESNSSKKEQVSMAQHFTDTSLYLAAEQTAMIQPCSFIFHPALHPL